VRKNKQSLPAYFKYAAWEDNNGNVDRARSIYERCIDMNHRDVQLWLRYSEMEQKNKQVQHARNIFDRAVTIMPRANQFWYKYVFMEETLNNVAGCRAVFERWMEWQPDEQSWAAFINFETRYQETERVRSIYERFIVCHPMWKNWQKYAKFEERQGLIENARHIYERAVEFFNADDASDSANLDANLLISFASFEQRQKEEERARVIYKYGLDTLLRDVQTEEEKNKLAAEDPKVKTLLDAYTRFEKQFGTRAKIESQISAKRKAQYENRVARKPHDYDAWFDYIRLMENRLPKGEDAVEEDYEKVREIFERAITNIPPAEEKRYWRRYIYLWINYAVFEETIAQNFERTEQVYQSCIQLLPHEKFTFAKIWIMYAHFLIRRLELTKARRTLGQALGRCPKGRLFKAYIELETELREFDRVRKLYNKYVSFNSENCQVWIRFAELETMLGDTERARAIYGLAAKQDRLDMPEVLWKNYIDFEVENEEWNNARVLYRRLLKKTNHIKVWTAMCQFEFTVGGKGAKKTRYERTTQVFNEATDVMRQQYKQAKNDAAMIRQKEELTEEDEFEAEQMVKTALENRLTILDTWKSFEDEHGESDSDAFHTLKLHLPKRIKKRRKVTMTQDGESGGWEEYWDYIFPEEEEQKSSFKLLQMARAWKETKQVEDSYDPASGVDSGADLGGEVPSYQPGSLAKQGEIDISDEDD